MRLKIKEGKTFYNSTRKTTDQPTKFHNDRGKVRYRLISAGTGSGKTIAGVAEDIRWAWGYPGSVGIIFEPTYKMIQRILIHQTFEDFFGFKPLESNKYTCHFHKTELRLEVETGGEVSTIYFISLEKPESAEGTSIDWAHVDEARLIPKFGTAWESIQRRLRGSGKGYPSGAWVTTTPPPINTPLYDFFENPKTKDPQSKVYRWSIFDNAEHLPPGYIESVVRSHTGILAERFVYGRFVAAGMGSFPFDQTIHVLTDISLRRMRDINYGVDFGWTNPSCILAVGYDGDGRAYVLDEVYERQMTDEELIEESQNLITIYGKGVFHCDPTEPQTIEKMRRVQPRIRAEPYKMKRADGLRELGSRFAIAGDGKPRIFISSKCVNLISELMEYNIDKKENDHAVDALRYALKIGRRRRGDTFYFG